MTSARPRPAAAAAVGSAAGTAAAALRAGGAATRRAVAQGRRRLRQGGAEESGLATLTELCTINAAADALVAVALAGTVFFNVPVGEARGKVGLYLLITVAPFALLAPVIGPLLDRLHGRRVAMAGSMVVRAALCWALAGNTGGLALYPLALGVLVTGRAFHVARAAVMPRVLPAGMTLVSANSRVSLVGALGAGVIAPIGLGLSAVIGIGWVLRLATVVFLAAIVPCSRLPAHVDSDAGESAAAGLTRRALGVGRVRSVLGGLPTALRAVVSLRALVGFLTLFLAFKLRTGGSGKSGLAGLAAAALAGQAAGIVLGNRLGRRRPELLISAGLVLATAVCLAGAFLYSGTTALLVALLATMAAALGKLGLDAVIQRDVAEKVRASAFASSETALQLAWVTGGALGLAPLTGTQGFGVAATGMVLAFGTEVAALRASRAQDAPRRRQPRPPVPVVPAAREATGPPPPDPPPPDPTPPDPPPALLRRPARPAPDPHIHRFSEPEPDQPGVAPGQTLRLPFPEEPSEDASRAAPR